MSTTDNTEPRNNLIVLYGILSVIAVVILCVALTVLFMHTTKEGLLNVVERAPTDKLNAIRSHEDNLLLNAAYDPVEKIGRIPISTAIELESQNPWHPQATPLPGTPNRPLDPAAAAEALTAAATTATTASLATDAATTATLTLEPADATASTTGTQTPAAVEPAPATDDTAHAPGH